MFESFIFLKTSNPNFNGLKFYEIVYNKYILFLMVYNNFVYSYFSIVFFKIRIYFIVSLFKVKFK